MQPLDTLYTLIKRGKQGKNIGLKTSISKMDEYTGGMQKGMYNLIFGLSGSGKTSWVLYTNIYRPLKDYPDEDIKIVYYSLEMSSEILLAKLLCIYIYEEFGKIIPYINLLSWSEILDDESYDYVLKAKSWLEKVQSKFIIFDKSLSAKWFYSSMMSLLEQWGSFVDSEDNKRKIYIKTNPNQWIFVVIDHLGLARPSAGRDKKQEIDEISEYAVGFRNKCNIGFYILMQENRNSSNMDRRKAEMSESSAEDIKDSGNPYNDCDICIAIYNPLKHKVTTYRDYKIIVDHKSKDQFIGMRDRFRSAILIKNRYGKCDKVVGLNFFGELGIFKELPKGEDILDYSQYMFIDNINNVKDEIKDKIKDKMKDSDNQKQTISYKF